MDPAAFRLSDRPAIADGVQSIQMEPPEILGQDLFSDRAIKPTYRRFARVRSGSWRVPKVLR
jgi:hypothetical protein